MGLNNTSQKICGLTQPFPLIFTMNMNKRKERNKKVFNIMSADDPTNLTA